MPVSGVRRGGDDLDEDLVFIDGGNWDVDDSDGSTALGDDGLHGLGDRHFLQEELWVRLSVERRSKGC